jgi:hypothetical protein
MLSDRDKIFKTVTWAQKMKAIGSKQVLSTAHHQQTDGQSERKIQELQAYYRHFLDYDQENWIELTPIAQYALNDVINATTGETPNFILYGTTRSKTENLQEGGTSLQTEKMRAIHQQIQLDTEWNHHKARQYYDEKRKESISLKPEDYVYLKRRTIGRNEFNIRTKRKSSKLDCVHLGPFKVTDKLGNDNYRLQLPERMKIHPEFHISLLEPTKNTKSYGDEDAFDEYEVEAIVGKRVNTNGKTEYLVNWKGYDSEENSWEEPTNLFCPDKIREYEQSTDRHRPRNSSGKKYRQVR